MSVLVHWNPPKFFSDMSNYGSSHHSHWLQGIDGKARTFPIEAAVAVPEGVDVAAIFVAKTLVALILVIVTTLNAFTHVLPLSRNVAWVRGIGSCHVVGLPNIHLGTAGAIVTKAHAVAEILWVWLPVLRVGDAIDELDVMRALGITVTSPILGTRLVLAQTLPTIAGHLHEVHGTVHATFHSGGVHIHCKPGWSMMSLLRHPDSEKTNAGDLGIILFVAGENRNSFKAPTRNSRLFNLKSL